MIAALLQRLRLAKTNALIKTATGSFSTSRSVVAEDNGRLS